MWSEISISSQDKLFTTYRSCVTYFREMLYERNWPSHKYFFFAQHRSQIQASTKAPGILELFLSRADCLDQIPQGQRIWIPINLELIGYLLPLGNFSFSHLQGLLMIIKCTGPPEKTR